MAEEAAEELESLVAIFGDEVVVDPHTLSVRVALPPSFRIVCPEESALACEIPRRPLESSGRTRSFRVNYMPPITLHFECGPEYPATKPPSFTLTCPWLTLKQVSLSNVHQTLP